MAEKIAQAEAASPEKLRLNTSKNNRTWKKWGPYLADRQWGTVREDYSNDGSAWDFISHDMARSNAYRWGEEGLGGFCDREQIICLAPAFWNGNDPILKERLFGVTNGQGNHGEDVKELYYHLESSPTHSYCKMLYKYPHQAFPYDTIVKNLGRSKEEPEYEITDTDVFDDNRYFDIFIEYAKGGLDDVLMSITVVNRGDEPHWINVLPHIWFRNYWKHNSKYSRPQLVRLDDRTIQLDSDRIGTFFFHHEAGPQLYCENETNNKRIYNVKNDFNYVKDGINDHVVKGLSTVNPKKTGTKAAIWYKGNIQPGQSKTFRVRMSTELLSDAFADYDEIFEKRKAECDAYYEDIVTTKDPQAADVQRKAFAGLMWTKQWYYYDVHKWRNGEVNRPSYHRHNNRNHDWQHFVGRNILSMPDKWEYPWFAAWDLAFHATTFGYVDPSFAKRQLLLMLREYYLHPNGQIPAYEWNFSDVNPPVHAWAVWKVYQIDKDKTGVGDHDFLERAFQKLLMNFTWWVNRKDETGSNLFEGGFLGLDNIGVFDRNNLPDGISHMEQSDATSWMCMFSLNMMHMSIELAQKNPAYQESASKFFRHFLDIAWVTNNIGANHISLWDDEDGFYYDIVQNLDGTCERLKVRSLVGIIPLFAIEVIHHRDIIDLNDFTRRAQNLTNSRPDLAQLVSRIERQNDQGFHLFSLMRGYRLERLMERLLDEAEFLSDYGIRSLSKIHETEPYTFKGKKKKHTIRYEPGESRSSMFGGNSNWRGPIWFPLNYLIIESLRKFHRFYGDSYVYEFPKGSGQKLNLRQIANELSNRLLSLFKKDEDGEYHYHTRMHGAGEEGAIPQEHLFYEFFHGDNGKGLGASHQTGWTALIANLILERDEEE